MASETEFFAEMPMLLDEVQGIDQQEQRYYCNSREITETIESVAKTPL